MYKLVKFSLVAVLSLGLMPNTSFAQEDSEEVEEVIVTGSKIKKSIFDSSKPLEIVSADAIERTGLNNIGDVLQNISSSDGTGIRPVTTLTNGGDGSNEISLRNLGSEKKYFDDVVKSRTGITQDIVWANIRVWCGFKN